VVPHDDPTLMFTNAGMNQFKDVFLGTGSVSFSRAADTQKCIRAGGKHNDLDDVGKDTYHHTFFEMLGNWSFGDYFKEDAIRWAWELMTGVWGLEKDRLHATYFEGDESEGLAPDEEARDLWKSVTDIPHDHIHPGNKKDNFWEMGSTGPCGPCSEIHIDLTPDKSGRSLVNEGSDQVIELWNLVFIQFNRGNDGKLSPLPAKHVDTGMGFERITAVLQGKKSNYDSDVFLPLFDSIREISGADPYAGTLPKAGQNWRDDSRVMMDIAYRVIADHARCLTFAITDGAMPSNEGRGYVLRRILRRAYRYGRQFFALNEPFMCRLVDCVAESMGDVFPELRKNPQQVRAVIEDEERTFARTLDRGLKLFHEAADHALKHHHGRLSGESAFKLHDTYGFPIDLTELMAEEFRLTIDIGEYERLMEEAREKARAGGKSDDSLDLNLGKSLPATDDAEKYSSLETETTLIGYVAGGQFVEAGDVPEDELVGLVLDQTCFYGEQGGQVGDTGSIVSSHAGGTATFEVRDTKRHGEAVIHVGRVRRGESALTLGRRVRASVNDMQRSQILKNHTSTHVLNWALREVLGDLVMQKGSLVDAEKTRFDFSHGAALKVAELERIQSLVNDQIDRNLVVYDLVVDQKQAMKIHGLRAVFGEKYPEHVRVVSIGQPVEALLENPDNDAWRGYSIEFCGGTHLKSTGEAGRFVLTAEEAVAKGVRRVIGVTGSAAREAGSLAKSLDAKVTALAGAEVSRIDAEVGVLLEELNTSVIPLLDRLRLRNEIAELQKKARDAKKAEAGAAAEEAMAAAKSLFDSAEQVNGTAVIVGELPGAQAEQMREAIDWYRQKSDSTAVMLVSSGDGKVMFLAGMSRDLVGKGVKAGDLIKELAPIVGGRGGGRPDMAQGGGTDVSSVGNLLESGRAWIMGKLS
jgi:alanyl-tRNA synthetase